MDKILCKINDSSIRYRIIFRVKPKPIFLIEQFLYIANDGKYVWGELKSELFVNDDRSISMHNFLYIMSIFNSTLDSFCYIGDCNEENG